MPRPSALPRPLAPPPGTMRKGAELILATKRFARDSTARSWWHVLSTALLLGLALAGTLGCAYVAAKLACSILAGLLLLRLFVIYHDQQHHAILARSRLAAGLMRVFGILALSPSSVWRSSHNHHHNHNSKLRGSQIGSFPVMTRSHFEKCPPAERRRYLAMRHPLTILAGYGTTFLFGMCLKPFLNDPRQHSDGLLALVLHIAIGVALVLTLGPAQWLLTQTLPAFITYGLGSYLFYAQHNFPGVSYHSKLGWTHEKAALASSSFLRTSRLMAWFTGNIGYHHIHHLNAKIPFYRLPEVARAMPELQNPIATSLHPWEIRRCLRLKVWDEQLQRMIGLREMELGAFAI